DLFRQGLVVGLLGIESDSGVMPYPKLACPKRFPAHKATVIILKRTYLGPWLAQPKRRLYNCDNPICGHSLIIIRCPGGHMYMGINKHHFLFHIFILELFLRQ